MRRPTSGLRSAPPLFPLSCGVVIRCTGENIMGNWLVGQWTRICILIQAQTGIFWTFLIHMNMQILLCSRNVIRYFAFAVALIRVYR